MHSGEKGRNEGRGLKGGSYNGWRQRVATGGGLYTTSVDCAFARTAERSSDQYTQLIESKH